MNKYLNKYGQHFSNVYDKCRLMYPTMSANPSKDNYNKNHTQVNYSKNVKKLMINR